MTTQYPLCNLCKKNPADHLGSHIFPRFMGVTLLMTSDNKRISYTTDELDPTKQNPKQGTPKVPHILCSTCESKIGSLEREFANKFYYPFQKGEYQKQCSTSAANSGFDVLTNDKPDYNTFKLVIYSMAFRASVSGHIAFQTLFLKDSQKELLRQILNEEVSFVDIPIYTLTSVNPTQQGANYVFASTCKENVAWLWANEFIFYIDFEDDSNIFRHAHFKMHGNQKIKIAVVPNNEWHKLRLLVAEIIKKQKEAKNTNH